MAQENGAIVPRTRRLDQMAVECGLITEEQRQKALLEEKRSGRPLHEILETHFAVGHDAVVLLLVEEAGIPKLEAKEIFPDSEILKLVPQSFALEKKVLLLARQDSRLKVAMANPFDLRTIEEIGRLTRCYVDACYVPFSRLEPLIESFYQDSGGLDSERGENAVIAVEEGAGGGVVRIVDELFGRAIDEGATDIHLEPTAKNLATRLRVDGLLHPGPVIPKILQAAVTTRVKVMADLNISQNRLPQDGSIRYEFKSKTYDLRVSTFPTIHGEAVMLRILDRESLVLGLEELGFSRHNLALYKQAVGRPNGIILITGPTGSGKTTTLYSTLSEINSGEKNIVTVEDPVEYELEGIRQSQVNSLVGMTFAVGLRAILRQDPDIILVGEIRDRETMDIAIAASLSGHLVFSTVHTNDAAGAIPRLLDLGVEAYLLASSLSLCMAQRLVRKVCKSCKAKYKPDEGQLFILGLEPGTERNFVRGRGCNRCLGTGYRGRVGIFEALPATAAIRELISARADSERIKEQAKKEGLITMMEEGKEKMLRGLTTVEEVIRVAHTI